MGSPRAHVAVAAALAAVRVRFSHPGVNPWSQARLNELSGGSFLAASAIPTSLHAQPDPFRQ